MSKIMTKGFSRLTTGRYSAPNHVQKVVLNGENCRSMPHQFIANKNYDFWEVRACSK